MPARERAGYRPRVRWDALFADLEAQMHATDASDEEVAGLVRAEVGRTELADRLRAHLGVVVALQVTGGQWWHGAVLEAAPQWLLLDQSGPALGSGPGTRFGAGGAGGVSGATRQVLVPLPALQRITGLGAAVAPPAGTVERRLGLGSALRALARDRIAVVVALASGEVAGTIDRVAADHLDLAVHPVGEARRPSAVTDVVALPFHAVLAVRSAAPTAGHGGS